MITEGTKKKNMTHVSPFVPNTSQWVDYFKSQAEAKSTAGRNTVSDAFSPVGGGIGVNSDNTTLTRLGKVKSQPKGRRSESVKVELTSPVEATVEQARDMLKNIKDDRSADTAIRRKSLKRKTSVKKQRSSGGKKKRSRKYKDVFSK